MDKIIEITNRAVADYGFRQAALYGSEDIARRWNLNEAEKNSLETTVIPLLAALPIPVEPDDVSHEQIRLANLIRPTTDQ